MTGAPGRERRPGPPASGTGAITQTQVQGDTETVSTFFETFNLFGPAPGPRSRRQAALEETIAKLRHLELRYAGREAEAAEHFRHLAAALNYFVGPITDMRTELRKPLAALAEHLRVARPW